MSNISNATGNPLMEFVSKGDNPLKILTADSTQKCVICGHESNSLYILSFNMLACQICFDFALSCNYFDELNPIDIT